MNAADFILVLAIPFFLGGLAVESSVLRRRGTPYEKRDSIASISMGAGNLVISGVWQFAQLAVLVACFRVAPWHLRGAWAWVGVMIGWDFTYYWNHRAGHEVRLFWATHVNHHSSRRYNLSTALRQDWTPMYHTLFLIPLALVGFSPTLIVVAGAVNLLYQFWIHTELIDRLGPLELLLNTPSHHRVHHGSNPRYLDRNYGGILIVWDRMFGTFEPEGEAVVFGLTKNIDTFNPVRIAFHEWRALWADVQAAGSWRERAEYVLRGPGWSMS